MKQIKVRDPKFAGQFYPEDADELGQLVGNYINKPDLKSNKELIEKRMQAKRLKGLIVPHAGYVFSGSCAGYGYKAMKEDFLNHIISKDAKTYEKALPVKAIILGLSHRIPFSGIALAGYESWSTPLGQISQAEYLSSKLLEYQQFSENQNAHEYEHSIEVQLPFLQALSDMTAQEAKSKPTSDPKSKSKLDLEIVPALTSNTPNHNSVAESISANLNQKTIFIISTDLSHYLPLAKAKEKDQKTIQNILQLKKIIDEDAACGLNGINILIETAKINKWEPILLNYATSADARYGDPSRVVGYCVVGFYA
jgi:hypothetical protein